MLEYDRIYVLENRDISKTSRLREFILFVITGTVLR